MYARAPEEDLLARQREAKAVELRLKGYEFEEIALECGYISADGKPLKGSAYKAWQRAIRQVKPETVNEARVAMQKRLNMYRKMLLRSLLGPVLDPTRVYEALTKIEEREAKLFGLDAPTEAENNAVPFTKRIIIEYSDPVVDALPVVGNDVEAGE